MAGKMYLGNQMVTPVIVKAKGGYIGREVTPEGKYQIKVEDTFILPEDIKDVGDHALENVLRYTSVKQIDFGSLKTVSGEEAFYNFAVECTNLTNVNLGSLEEVSGKWAFEDAFNSCSNLQHFTAENLKIVSGYQCFYLCLDHCPLLETLEFPNLEVIGNNGFYGLISYDGNVREVSFPKLRKVTSASLETTFRYCKISYVEFPALTDLTEGWWAFDSFCYAMKTMYFSAVTPESFSQEKTAVFAGMLAGTQKATVFFPSSVENVIGDWSDILSGCGGTNATILFHLPTKIKVTGIDGLSLKANGYPYKKDYVVVATQTANFLVVKEDENKNVLCIETNCEEGEERVVDINVDSYSYKKITINDPLQTTGQRILWNGLELALQEETAGVYSTYVNNVVGATLTYKNDGTMEYKGANQTFETTGNDITITITTPEERQTRTFTRPNLTSNGTMGGNAFAVEGSRGTYAWRAVDSSTSTYWSSGSDSSKWYKIYNPNSLFVNSFEFRWDGAYYRATKIILYASNDNESWENLGEFDTTSSDSYTLNTGGVGFYKYYKFEFTEYADTVDIRNLAINALEDIPE